MPDSIHEPNRQIANALRVLRSGRGWSLDRTAQETGVSKAMLGQIERCESSPTIATLWKIASGFQTSLSSLIEPAPPASTDGVIRRSVEASEATAEATADDLAAATLSLQAQVAQSYFLLRVQDAEIRLLRSTVAQYERSLELTRNRYAARVASLGAVVQDLGGDAHGTVVGPERPGAGRSG